MFRTGWKDVARRVWAGSGATRSYLNCRMYGNKLLALPPAPAGRPPRASQASPPAKAGDPVFRGVSHEEADGSASCRPIPSPSCWLGLIFLGLWRVFRPALRAGLRVADGFRQHLAQFRLALRWCPGDRCLPMCHGSYVGMPEAELKPPWSPHRSSSSPPPQHWRHRVWVARSPGRLESGRLLGPQLMDDHQFQRFDRLEIFRRDLILRNREIEFGLDRQH